MPVVGIGLHSAQLAPAPACRVNGSPHSGQIERSRSGAVSVGAIAQSVDRSGSGVCRLGDNRLALSPASRVARLWLRAACLPAGGRRSVLVVTGGGCCVVSLECLPARVLLVVKPLTT